MMRVTDLDAEHRRLFFQMLTYSTTHPFDEIYNIDWFWQQDQCMIDNLVCLGMLDYSDEYGALVFEKNPQFEWVRLALGMEKLLRDATS